MKKTITKTVKQYSYEVDDYKIEELLKIGKEYKNVKNYVYSRYSGIKSLLIIEKPRKIRDEWVSTKFYEQWDLPARYWKLALQDAIGNIKSGWSNTKNEIRTAAYNNEHLSTDDRYYINYILSANKLYYNVLNNINFDIPKKFEGKNLNIKYLNNLIKRYTRRYKGKVPYTNKINSFSIDTGLYRYSKNNTNENYIYISSMETRKRVPIKLRDSNKYNKTLKIKIIDNVLRINIPLEVESKENTNENIIGIDKGYRYLLATSNGNLYGEKLNYYLSKETERLSDKNANRNRFFALRRKYLEEGNTKKADNILKNNLGKKKYRKNKNKHDETVKSYINKNINKFIKSEKPKEVVMENLDFVNWDDRYPKSVKRKLSRWIKGYIKDRLEYKLQLNSIEFTYINPAYTSQICSKCGRFGVRNGDLFTCDNCGEIHADINASKNILERKYDKEIKMFTSYKKVKEILESRIADIK